MIKTHLSKLLMNIYSMTLSISCLNIDFFNSVLLTGEGLILQKPKSQNYFSHPQIKLFLMKTWDSFENIFVVGYIL